jgi:hypothetical protein
MLQVKDHLESFDEDLCENGVGVSQRSYIATASLLAYCSVLRFPFQGALLPRGWLDILIIGDTACGKSKIVETIVQKIKMGEFIKGENTSFAGLIGGLQQVGSRAKWDVVWGRIPLNHGKLLVCDEMSSLTVDAIGDMSAVRSSGIAEIVKVQGGVTRAATRMIWIGNPRSDSTMAGYPFGIQALQELVGRPEDIRRFDFALGVTTSDVPLDIVNKHRDVSGYKGKWDELRQLVRWAWQLRPQEVSFDPRATDTILACAREQAKSYSSEIPLVEPNEQRVKIARVAVAVAVRCLSEQNGGLIVKKEHVEYADHFMRKCFDSHALGYKRFSAAREKQQRKGLGNLLPLKEVLQRYDSAYLRTLMECKIVALADIETIFDVCRPEARNIISKMIQSGFLVRKNNGFVKSPLAVEILEKLANDDAPAYS